jgi:hypothetical protein
MTAEERTRLSKDVLDKVNDIGVIKLTLEWGHKLESCECTEKPRLAQNLGSVSEKAMKGGTKSHVAGYVIL